MADDTRWLDEEEQRTWRSFMLATRLLWDQFERDLQRTSRMPMAYYEVLVRLSEAPERTMRMSDLAQLSQNSRSRLSHAVARMEESGWVRRESCPSDRRGAMAVLTDEGFRLLEETAPLHVTSVRAHLFDALPPADLDELRRLSELLLTHLSTVGVLCPSLLPGVADLPEESAVPG
jgi:DNA-binding MarR family transcriptional regulator